MEMKRKWRLAVPLAAVLLVGACSDGNTPAGPDAGGPMFSATQNFNNLGACMGDDSYASKLTSGQGSPTDLNCTANDIEIAQAVVNSVSFDNKTFTPFTGQAISCNEGDKIYVNMNAIIEQNANSERTDIGIWIAQDGGTAVTGSCNHYNLLNGDKGVSNLDSDSCGDMKAGATGDVPLGVLELTCTDADGDGKLQVGSCLGWTQPGGDVACPYNGSAAINFRYGTVPANKSKCNCEPFDLPIDVLKTGKLNVRKVCSPTSDAGTFDLKIDGSVGAFGNNKACGTQTGLQTVSAGTTASPGALHTFAEDDFTTANYNSSWQCTLADATTGAPTGGVISQCGAGGNASCSGSGTGPNTIKVNPNQNLACTFTNERKASITIRKDVTPSSSTQSFGFTSPTLSPTSFSLQHNGSRVFSNISPATYRITEDALTGWDLTAIDCQTATGVSYSVNLASRFVDITVGAGGGADCTFRNRQRGTIVIVKQTDPNAATGSFGFASPSLSPTSFNLSDGGTQTFNNVVPGAYTVTENDPVALGFDLVASGDGHTTACSDPTTNSSITLATRVASINVAAGETVTCTFVNRRRATVTVNKRQNGTLTFTRTWTFEIRTGASTTSAGTVVATGTNNATTGVVTFSCPTSNSSCANVSGVANFVPGSYQLCETGMPAGWSNNITGFTPAGAVAEGGDNSTECINITLGTAGSGNPTGVPNPIDNIPPPGGDARTIGYWKNWSSCTKGNQYDKAIERGDADRTLDFYLGGGSSIYPFGDITSLTCQQAVYLLSKSDLDGVKRASDAAYNMAAQLLAAKLNKASGAATPLCTNAAITAAQNLLAQSSPNGVDFTGFGPELPSGTTLTTLRNRANQLAGVLDAYNNNELTGAICTAAGF